MKKSEGSDNKENSLERKEQKGNEASWKIRSSMKGKH